MGVRLRAVDRGWLLCLLPALVLAVCCGAAVATDEIAPGVSTSGISNHTAGPGTGTCTCTISQPVRKRQSPPGYTRKMPRIFRGTVLSGWNGRLCGPMIQITRAAGW